MRRWLPYFLLIWKSVVFALVLGAFTNWVFGPFRESVSTFLEAHWLLITLALLALGGLTLWSWIDRARHEHAERARQLCQYFALCKPAITIRPEDLGFHVLKSGEAANTGSRPHYEVYIPRQAVLYYSMSQENSQH